MNITIKAKPLPKHPNRVKPAINSMRITVEPSKKGNPFLAKARAQEISLKLMLRLMQILEGDKRYRASLIRVTAHTKDEDLFSFNLTYPTDKLEEAKELVIKEADKAGVWNMS